MNELERMSKIDAMVRGILADAFDKIERSQYACVANEFVGSELLLPGFYSSVPEFVDWLIRGALRGIDHQDIRSRAVIGIASRIRDACFAASEDDTDTDSDMDTEIAAARKALEMLC